MEKERKQKAWPDNEPVESPVDGCRGRCERGGVAGGAAPPLSPAAVVLGECRLRRRVCGPS